MDGQEIWREPRMTIKRLPDRETWLMDCLAAKMGERVKR